MSESCVERGRVWLDSRPGWFREFFVVSLGLTALGASALALCYWLLVQMIRNYQAYKEFLIRASSRM